MSNKKMTPVVKESLNTNIKTMQGRTILVLINKYFNSVTKFSDTFNIDRQTVYYWIKNNNINFNTFGAYMASVFKFDIELVSYIDCAVINRGNILEFSDYVHKNSHLLEAYLDYILDGKEVKSSKIWKEYQAASIKKYTK